MWDQKAYHMLRRAKHHCQHGTLTRSITHTVIVQCLIHIHLFLDDIAINFTNTINKKWFLHTLYEGLVFQQVKRQYFLFFINVLFVMFLIVKKTLYKNLNLA